MQIRTSFWRRARLWPRRRRILVKLEVAALGRNLRFMVTNQPGRAADLFAWYDDRGQYENGIKDLIRDVLADWLSCHR